MEQKLKKNQTCENALLSVRRYFAVMLTLLQEDTLHKYFHIVIFVAKDEEQYSKHLK